MELGQNRLETALESHKGNIMSDIEAELAKIDWDAVQPNMVFLARFVTKIPPDDGAMCLVAARGSIDDWAAYAMPCKENACNDATAMSTYHWGTKLSEPDARTMFPGVPLTYRS